MSQSRSIHLNVHIHKSPAAMAERAAHYIAERCEEAIQERGVFTLAISGGSTPSTLFKLLAEQDWTNRLPWEKIVIYWVDERCVPPSDPQSNYGFARQELLSHVPITWFYRMKGEDDPEQAAEAYEALLREHFRLGENEFPTFDCILLGLGEDGHIASLFPGEQGLEENKRLVIDQYVRKLRTNRLTLTLPVINNARSCVFLVSGKDKYEPLSHALNLLGVQKYPAQFVRPKGDLVWIVDEAAALG